MLKAAEQDLPSRLFDAPDFYVGIVQVYSIGQNSRFLAREENGPFFFAMRARRIRRPAKAAEIFPSLDLFSFEDFFQLGKLLWQILCDEFDFCAASNAFAFGADGRMMPEPVYAVSMTIALL